MLSKTPASRPAQELLDVIPGVMREIRSQMRSRTSEFLTVPQLRALSFVNRNGGSTLSDLAAHIGLTLPSASRMVDGLASKGLVTREEHPVDRRRVRLYVTRRGRSILSASRSGTLAHLSKKLEGVGEDERETVVRAMGVLRETFLQKPTVAGGEGRGGSDSGQMR